MTNTVMRNTGPIGDHDGMKIVGNNDKKRIHCDERTPDETRPKLINARPKTMKNTMGKKAGGTKPARVSFADVVRFGKANKSPTNEAKAHSLETIKSVK